MLAGLFTRSRCFARRERLFTLDPWLPCTISSSEEEQESHTTCELPYTSTTPKLSTTIVYPPIYSSGSSIFCSKYRPTPTHPLQLSPLEKSLASTRSLQEEHGDIRLPRHRVLRFKQYLHILTMATSTAPSTAQGSKPAAPANGNVIKRYIPPNQTHQPSRPDQTNSHTPLPASNPNSWPS